MAARVVACRSIAARGGALVTILVTKTFSWRSLVAAFKRRAVIAGAGFLAARSAIQGNLWCLGRLS